MTFGAFQWKLRPFVEAAWKIHAGLYGVSTSNRAEREEWYRTHLWVAARVKSSKDATESQRVALVAYFRRLAGATDQDATQANVRPFPGIRVAGWSPAQHMALFKLARKAHEIALSRTDAPEGQSMEQWLSGEMQKVFDPIPVALPDGRWDLGSRTHGFDQAMAALAVVAFDEYWIGRTASGGETRVRWQLDRFLSDLSWLEGKEVGWEYVREIFKQADLPAERGDVPASTMCQVLDMLDTHIRRLCRRFGLRPCCCPTREPQGSTQASIDAWREWSFYHQPAPGRTRSPDGKPLQEKGVA